MVAGEHVAGADGDERVVADRDPEVADGAQRGDDDRQGDEDERADQPAVGPATHKNVPGGAMNTAVSSPRASIRVSLASTPSGRRSSVLTRNRLVSTSAARSGRSAAFSASIDSLRSRWNSASSASLRGSTSATSTTPGRARHTATLTPVASTTSAVAVPAGMIRCAVSGTRYVA